MNYNKLRYFYTVAQKKNFTKAADELYISQSAVSRHMKELEADFGVALFERTNRDLVLTDAGQALYEEIQYFFSKENDIYQKVREAANKDICQLNVGFMGIRPAYNISQIVNLLVLENPALSINLRRYNWDEILSALKSREIDIALRLRMDEMTDSSFKSFTLDSDCPAMVVPKSHPAVHKKKASLHDFQQDTFLMLSGKDSAVPHTYTKELFDAHHFKPKRYAEYDQVETILFLIHAGSGVSLLSRFAATDQFTDLKVVELGGTEPIYLELIWMKGNANPYIEKFKNTMRDSYHP